MNNKEYIAALSQRLGMKTDDTMKWVNTVLLTMGDNFQEGNSVSVMNFGSFEVKKKMERVLVSPTTGQRMLIPPKLVLGFRPNTAWKEKLKKGEKE